MAAKIIITVDTDLEEIIPQFLTKRKEEVPLMFESLKEKNFSDLRAYGHKLKGSCGGYGFDFLGALGAKIEKASLAQDLNEITAILKEIEYYLQQVEVKYS